MTNSFQSLLEKLKKGNNLELGNNENFSTEIILDYSLQCSTFGGSTFINVSFKNIDFTGSFFSKTTFENCRFSKTIFRKAEFCKCTFCNCEIEESNFTRAEFTSSIFRNCEFLKSNLGGSYFIDSEFREIKFNNNNLELIIVDSVKLWKSNQCTKIKISFNFEKILNDLDLISNDEI